MLAFQELIVHAEGLGARPDAVAELLRILEDPTVEAGRLLPVVQNDIGLTSRLLRTCNSPLYGLRRQVGSVREALVLMGNRSFARMAFLLCMEDVLRRDLPAYRITRDSFWRHGLMTAIGAAHVIDRLGRSEERDRAFTAGLLHDCGKILLARDLEGLTEGVPNLNGHIPVEIERDLTGFDHAEAGCVMMDHWGFPPLLVHTIRCHHHPDAAGRWRDVALAVEVADTMAHIRALGLRCDEESPCAAYDKLMGLGLDVGIVRELEELLPSGPEDVLADALRGAPARA